MHKTMYQIHRARYATFLLREGMPILEAVHEAGYFDQPHLTRSLKQFVGLTPAQITDKKRIERLSFLYKTTSFAAPTIRGPKDEDEKNNRIRIPAVG